MSLEKETNQDYQYESPSRFASNVFNFPHDYDYGTENLDDELEPEDEVFAYDSLETQTKLPTIPEQTSEEEMSPGSIPGAKIESDYDDNANDRPCTKITEETNLKESFRDIKAATKYLVSGFQFYFLL